VPVGGGGLVSGIAAWLRHALPTVRIIGVEPENAPAMALSVNAGEPVTIQSRPTVADGLMPVRPGDLNFAHVRAFVDDVVLVSDDAIVEASRLLLAQSKLVVEFSGAATVAALLSGAWQPAGRRTVTVLSGGNMDFARALPLLGIGQVPAVAGAAP
jgi:threonine dehydratase